MSLVGCWHLPPVLLQTYHHLTSTKSFPLQKRIICEETVANCGWKTLACYMISVRVLTQKFSSCMLLHSQNLVQQCVHFLLDIRTTEQADHAHSEGSAFVRGYLDLAKIALRWVTGLSSNMIGLAHSKTEAVYCIWCWFEPNLSTVPLSLFYARQQRQEWFVRPKLHASKLHDVYFDLLCANFPSWYVSTCSNKYGTLYITCGWGTFPPYHSHIDPCAENLVYSRAISTQHHWEFIVHQVFYLKLPWFPPRW